MGLFHLFRRRPRPSLTDPPPPLAVARRPDPPIPYAPLAAQETNVRIHQALLEVTDYLGEVMGGYLRGLVLAPPYGAAAGGVSARDGDESPTTSLVVYPVVTRRPAVRAAAVAALAWRMSNGVPVRVAPALTGRSLARIPRTRGWFDLVQAHTVLSGPPDLLREAPSDLRRPLPAGLAMPLMLEAGARLLQAMRLARGSAPRSDPDELQQVYHDCVLAQTDALLIAHQVYSGPAASAAEAIERLAAGYPEVGAVGLSALAADAQRYRLRPDTAPLGVRRMTDLQALSLSWGRALLLVDRRLRGRGSNGVAEWARSRHLREPNRHRAVGAPGRWLGNLRRLRLSGRHPREHLYRELPALLGLCGAWHRDWDRQSADFLSRWATWE